MAKTIQQISEDYYFQDEGKTILDLCQYIGNGQLLKDYYFQDSGRTVLQILNIIGNEQLKSDYKYLGEGAMLRAIINYYSQASVPMIQNALRTGLPSHTNSTVGSKAFSHYQTYICNATDKIYVTWGAYTMGSEGTIIPMSQDITSFKPSIEINGVIHYFDFNGSDTTSIPAGTEVTGVLEYNFSANQMVWINSFSQCAAAPSTWPCGLVLDVAQKNEINNAAVDRTGQTRAQILSSGLGYNAVYNVMPPMRILSVRKAGMVAFDCRGDSIANGTHDTWTADVGWVTRAMKTLNMPYIMNAADGVPMSHIVSTDPAQVASEAIRRANTLPYVTHSLIQVCTNDVHRNTSGPSMASNIEAIKTINESYGVQTLIATCTPRTNAANSADFDMGAQTESQQVAREYYNSYIETNHRNRMVGLHRICGVDGTRRWTTAFGTPTSDGIHPGSVMQVGAAAYASNTINDVLAYGFSPLNLPNLRLYHDADHMAAGLTGASIKDSSHKQAHSEQATVGNQPAVVANAVNGTHKTIRFDSNDWMNLSANVNDFAANNHTFLIGMKRNAGSINNILVGKNDISPSATYELTLNTTGTKLTGRSTTSFAYFDYTVNAADGNHHIIGMRRNGTTNGVKTYFDGVLSTASGNGANPNIASQFVFGKSNGGAWNYIDSDVDWIIAVDTALTDAQLNQIAAWSNAKYGTAAVNL